MKDVAIIGAGPVGLFAVFELGMLGLKSVLIDGLPAVGGQCRALYPEKPIYDIPAYPSILAGELVDRLWAQAEPFEPDLQLGATVDTIDRHEDYFDLHLTTGVHLQARSILIAAGAGAFVPNRPPLEGIEAYENKSVFYFVEKQEQFRGKKIVIAGGGDSAVDWANLLADVAEKVTIVHRRPQFRAAPESVAKMEYLAQEGRLTISPPGQLDSLLGTNGHLLHVGVKLETGDTLQIEADVLLPFFGLMPSLGSIESWGLDIDKKTIRIDPATCATNLKGVYAIGDIAGYPRKLRLIVTGFAESAQAAHAIYEYINPDKPLHFVHSTDKGVTR